MTTSRTALFLSALIFAAAADAQPPGGGRFGLGIVVGEPTGVTGKVWLHPNHALDVTASWSFQADGFFAAIDYLFHSPPVARAASFDLPLYVGVGAALAAGRHHSAGIGVRVPLGVAFEFKPVPLELTLEVAPGAWLAPSTDFAIDGGVGLRYYF